MNRLKGKLTYWLQRLGLVVLLLLGSEAMAFRKPGTSAPRNETPAVNADKPTAQQQSRTIGEDAVPAVSPEQNVADSENNSENNDSQQTADQSGLNPANNPAQRLNQTKARSSGKKHQLTPSKSANSDSVLSGAPTLGHTEGRDDKNNSQHNKPTSTVKSVADAPLILTHGVNTSQQSLDQGLIEAQIDDVLSSAEFLALEQSAAFSQPLTEQDKAANALMDAALASDPEHLLNQLDDSDLMDYVAEDDLWKEQLTIEDEP